LFGRDLRVGHFLVVPKAASHRLVFLVGRRFELGLASFVGCRFDLGFAFFIHGHRRRRFIVHPAN
jgi:hypothetical protein